MRRWRHRQAGLSPSPRRYRQCVRPEFPCRLCPRNRSMALLIAPIAFAADSKNHAIFAIPPGILKIAAQFAHQKQAEAANWTFGDADVKRRLRSKPRVERWPAVDYLSGHFVRFGRDSDLCGPIATVAM